jgi:hypothetical protein
LADKAIWRRNLCGSRTGAFSAHFVIVLVLLLVIDLPGKESITITSKSTKRGSLPVDLR